jgi:mRNA interferase RelE/StbE
VKYRVEIETGARRALRGLPEALRRRIDPVIRSLADNPRPMGCRSLAGYSDTYRLRVGDFRIIYRIRDEVLVVLVIRIGHRGEVYRHLEYQCFHGTIFSVKKSRRSFCNRI